MEQYVKQKLKEIFRYDTFRPGQKEIIIDVLQGNDVFGILPTGTGKSLCYQLPCQLLPGLTLVISPLISLMLDQVRETKAYYFKEVAALHSMQTQDERQHILQHLAAFKLIYVSPELLQQPYILRFFKQVNISLFVVDEAHCISQWGHDFRPDYLRLRQIIQLLGQPPVLALTGTATEKVVQDVCTQLGLTNVRLHQYAIDRENIGLLVEHVADNQAKLERLIMILRSIYEPTIIYFSTRKMAEQIAQLLAERLSERSIAYYHGGMDSEARLKIQQQFLYDQIEIICATSAFGMGINKKNIRYVIHYQLPAQLEAFIQEIGRAGRDGKQSYSILLYAPHDETIPLSLIANELPSKKEITTVFTYLESQSNSSIQLKEFIASLQYEFQISETKIRLLLYHFETNGMIKENTIFLNTEQLHHVQKKIISFCNEWLSHKQQLFNKMFTYIMSNECLRMNLYKHFQTEITQKTNICCSNCGLTVADLIPREERPLRKGSEVSWQQQLRYILGIEERQ